MSLVASLEHVNCLEDKDVGHSRQLLAKHADKANKRELLSKLDNQVRCLSADIQQPGLRIQLTMTYWKCLEQG